MSYVTCPKCGVSYENGIPPIELSGVGHCGCLTWTNAMTETDKPTPPSAASGVTLNEPVIQFLLGSGDLFGKWFGEKSATDKPFWWREHVRAMAVAHASELAALREQVREAEEVAANGYSPVALKEIARLRESVERLRRDAEQTVRDALKAECANNEHEHGIYADGYDDELYNLAGGILKCLAALSAAGSEPASTDGPTAEDK